MRLTFERCQNRFGCVNDTLFDSWVSNMSVSVITVNANIIPLTPDLGDLVEYYLDEAIYPLSSASLV